MIPRYSTDEMDAVWSDTARFGRWLEVELLATEGHADLGLVPAAAARACRAGAPATDDGFVARCSPARRSPTTTWPRSSTSCRTRSAPRTGPGSTSA